MDSVALVVGLVSFVAGLVWLTRNAMRSGK